MPTVQWLVWHIVLIKCWSNNSKRKQNYSSYVDQQSRQKRKARASLSLKWGLNLWTTVCSVCFHRLQDFSYENTFKIQICSPELKQGTTYFQVVLGPLVWAFAILKCFKPLLQLTCSLADNHWIDCWNGHSVSFQLLLLLCHCTAIESVIDFDNSLVHFKIF